MNFNSLLDTLCLFVFGDVCCRFHFSLETVAEDRVAFLVLNDVCSEFCGSVGLFVEFFMELERCR